MKLFLSICCSCLMVIPSWAQFQQGRKVTISQPVWHDLYIAGGTVIVNAPVHGDLIVAGGTITINDTVTSDILVAGGTVTLNGFVGDDVRCAGGEITVLKNIKEDLMVTGGTVNIAEQVSVGGLIASGGELTVEGLVSGTVKSFSGKMTFNGIALHGLDCRGGKVIINGKVEGPAVLAANDHLVIGDQASFNADVRYWSPEKEVNFKNSLHNGSKALYDGTLQIEYGRWYYLGFTSVIGLLWYIGMVFLLVAIIEYLFSATLKKAGETAYDAALKSFGFGLLVWIGIPIAAAVACITVIGVPVGLILLTGYIIIALLASVITSVVAAHWLRSRSDAGWGFWRLVFTAFGIFIVLKIMRYTPFLGWIFYVLLVVIAFGAIAINIPWRKKPFIPVTTK